MMSSVRPAEPFLTKRSRGPTCDPLRLAFLALTATAWVATAGTAGAAAKTPFAIEIVDGESGRPVPLVTLETTDHRRFVTDSAGLVAVDDPGLFGEEVYFGIRSHGYEYPADGFGNRGKTLLVRPGETATIEIERRNIAERLYRVTGAGIYEHAVRLGREVPIDNPLLNAGVMGQDSVQAAVYRDRIRWFWGDTSLPNYPLGHFRTASAASALPGDGGLDPDRGVNLTYVTGTKGRSRGTFRVDGSDPIWIDGLCVVPDRNGRRHLVTHYTQVESLGNPRATGIAVWNEETRYFEPVVDLPLDSPARMHGSQATTVTEGGRDWIYFAAPYPLLRVPATYEAILDPSQYEAFTCLEEGQKWNDDALPHVARNSRGEAVYAWRPETAWVDRGRQAALVEAGALAEDEIWIDTRDAESGDPIALQRGSVHWNEYRERWIMIAGREFGTAFLGDLYYAEADAPHGPWPRARRILTHDGYSFYNPAHHPFFDRDGGRIIYFEGTYTRMFLPETPPTPRYEYNQILYRLDLSDERLHPDD